METLGGDLENIYKDVSNRAGPWDGVQGIGTYSAAVSHRN